MFQYQNGVFIELCTENRQSTFSTEECTVCSYSVTPLQQNCFKHCQWQDDILKIQWDKHCFICSYSKAWRILWILQLKARVLSSSTPAPFWQLQEHILTCTKNIKSREITSYSVCSEPDWPQLHLTNFWIKSEKNQKDFPLKSLPLFCLSALELCKHFEEKMNIKRKPAIPSHPPHQRIVREGCS